MADPAPGAQQPWPWQKSLRAAAERLDDLVRETVGLSLPPVDEAMAEAGDNAVTCHDSCPRCGDSVGEGESLADGCATCRNQPPLADRVVRLGTYDGSLRDIIMAIKFQRWWEMGHTLGRLLGHRVMSEARQEPIARSAVVVPVPMPWQRRLFRGIDHARVLAVGVAEAMECPVWQVLAKVNGVPQLALTPSDRERHGGKGLRIRTRLGGWNLSGRDVVLVDDVRTTGATIRRAVRLLRTLQPRSVTAAVVAVADDRSRRLRSGQVRAASSADTIE